VVNAYVGGSCRLGSGNKSNTTGSSSDECVTNKVTIVRKNNAFWVWRVPTCDGGGGGNGR
jgi:hypothetical protein